MALWFGIFLFFYFFPLLQFLHLLVRRLFFLSPTKIKFDPENQNPKTFSRGLHQAGRILHRILYILHRPRFYLIGLPFVIYALVAVVLTAMQKITLSHNQYYLLILTVLLVAWSEWHKSIVDMRAVEFLRIFDSAHPQVFFDRYTRDLALGGVDFLSSEGVGFITPENADFRKDIRPTLKSFLVYMIIIDTALFAHLCLKALSKMGENYAQTMVDHAGSMWGKRMLQISNSGFRLRGAENLNGKEGKFLLIFNHKSAFDFILTFFAFSRIQINGRIVRPRFVLAKDHFRDNFIVYRLLGIGRLCEAMGMIFIARSERKKSFENLKAAAIAISQKEIDLAIYPQGTRANGNFDRSNKRRDAGFYTTINPRDVNSDLAHLKKGPGYLVYDTLSELSQTEPDTHLHLVFVGIKGAANTLPKGSLKVQTNSEIEFTIGEVVSLSPRIIGENVGEGETQQEESKKQFALQINHLINDRLSDVLDLHDSLAQRYLTEIKGQFRFDHDKIGAVRKSLREKASESDMVFQILDRIYSLPLEKWNSYLSEMSQLLLEKADSKRLKLFLEDVSRELVKKSA